MVYMILLACESLTVSLLAVALLVAATSRGRNFWFRLARVGTLIVAVVIGVAYGALAFTTVIDLSREWSGQTPFLWMLSGVSVAVFFCYLIGTNLILRGWRVGPEERGLLPRAADWPLGGLAALFLAAVFIQLLTIVGLDVTRRQTLAAVRTEAYLLAASAAPPRVPDSQNAAPLYAAFAQTWKLRESWPKIYEDAVNALEAYYEAPPSAAGEGKAVEREAAPFDFANEALASFLQERASELALLRRAAAMPACRFERDYFRPTFWMLVPELQILRTAARLLALDAHHAAVVGNFPRAVEDINAIFGIARHAREPLMIGFLVSAAIERIAIRELEHLLSQPGLTEELLAPLEVDITPSLRLAVIRALHMEEAFGLLAFCFVGLGELRAENLAELASAQEKVLLSPPFLVVGFPWLMTDLANYREVFRQVQSAAGMYELPLVQQEGQLKAVEETLRKRRAESPLTVLIIPPIHRVFAVVTRGEALRVMAAAGVSVGRYALRHGHLPSDWADLVPEELPFAPVDPFDGKPLRMKLIEQTVVIYSVGPDFQDDGGRPIDREEKGDLTFVVRWRSLRPNPR